MKYFEFTFDTHPCTETVNDVLAAVLGEAGFESFVEREGGLTAYIQQSLYNEETLKTELANSDFIKYGLKLLFSITLSLA